MLRAATIYEEDPLPTFGESQVQFAVTAPNYAAANASVDETAAVLAKNEERRQLRNMLRQVQPPRQRPFTAMRQVSDISLSPRFAPPDFVNPDSTPIGGPVGGGWTPLPAPTDAGPGGPSSPLLAPLSGDGQPLPPEDDPLHPASDAPPLLDGPPPPESNPDNILLKESESNGPPADENPVEEKTAMNDISLLLNPRRLYRSLLS